MSNFMYNIMLIILFIYFKQRFDVIELVNHESMMAQLKEDLLMEKEQAILNERYLCEQKLARERQLKYDEKKDDLIVSSYCTQIFILMSDTFFFIDKLIANLFYTYQCILDDDKKTIEEKNKCLKYLKEKNTTDLTLNSYNDIQPKSNSNTVPEW